MEELAYPEDFGKYLVKSEHGLLQVSIKDNGIGMDEM